MFMFENGGYIHLNGQGVRALSDVYKQVLNASERPRTPDCRGDKDKFQMIIQTLIQGLSSLK